MFDKIRKSLQKDDVAVSAVIGTILMIAVTVVLGGVIYAAIGGFGAKDLGAQADPSVFRAIGIDSDNDGKMDSIQLTYFSGPEAIGSVIRVNGVAVCTTTAGDDGDASTLANPGDSCRVSAISALVVAGSNPDGLQGGNHQVVITVNGKVAFDSTVALQE